jgi:hypothetical protein
VADIGNINNSPKCIISPFSEHFSNEELLSRFRKSCLHSESYLYKGDELEVVCYVQQHTCRSIDCESFIKT